MNHYTLCVKLINRPIQIPFCSERRSDRCSEDCQCFWMARTTPENCPFPLGICTPSNTWFFWPTRIFIQNLVSIGSAVFVWVPNAMRYNALSIGKKTLKIAHSPWDFATLPENDRATAIGKTHKNLVKNSRVVCFSQKDRQRDRQTHRHTDILITILRNRFRERSKNKQGSRRYQTTPALWDCRQTCSLQYFLAAPAGEVIK